MQVDKPDVSIRIGKGKEMAEITAEQQQELRATAERALTKLQTFVDGLPDDERSVLAAVLAQTGAGQGSDDTQGYWASLAMYGARGGQDRGASGALDAVNSVDWQKVYDALTVDWSKYR
jgi:hypothetical protein